jgi:hypothetical protein
MGKKTGLKLGLRLFGKTVMIPKPAAATELPVVRAVAPLLFQARVAGQQQ